MTGFLDPSPQSEFVEHKSVGKDDANCSPFPHNNNNNNAYCTVLFLDLRSAAKKMDFFNISHLLKVFAHDPVDLVLVPLLLLLRQAGDGGAQALLREGLAVVEPEEQ